jgi:prepilin-type N-terminal cleavage/methylation domain-containing protein
MQVCNRPSQRRGFSLVELLIVLAVIAIILSIAVPTLTSAHMGASETVVMREVQSIHQAQAQYYSQFGDYASTLAQLGPPATGVAGPQGAKLLPASLASGEKDGYVFTMTKTPRRLCSQRQSKGLRQARPPHVLRRRGRCDSSELGAGTGHGGQSGN